MHHDMKGRRDPRCGPDYGTRQPGCNTACCNSSRPARGDGHGQINRTKETPAQLAVAGRCAQLRWLVPAIMKQWSRPFSAYFPRPLFSYVLTRWPDKIASEIAARWPDPVRATFELGRAFDDRPRWPLQATFFARSMMSFLARSTRN